MGFVLGLRRADDARKGIWAVGQGRVKWYSAAMGQGFIVPYDGSGDIFVHHTGISNGTGGLEKGAEVTYRVTRDNEGPRAENVKEA